MNYIHCVKFHSLLFKKYKYMHIHVYKNYWFKFRNDNSYLNLPHSCITFCSALNILIFWSTVKDSSPQSDRCTSMIYKSFIDKRFDIKDCLVREYVYIRKISGMHLLNDHINTLGLLLCYICANRISEYSWVFVWIIFKNLLPKISTLEALQVPLKNR